MKTILITALVLGVTVAALLLYMEDRYLLSEDPNSFDDDLAMG